MIGGQILRPFHYAPGSAYRYKRQSKLLPLFLSSLAFRMPTVRSGSNASRAFRRGLSTSSSQAPRNPEPELLPHDKLIDEERVPGYKSHHYYPANPGDVLARKYRLEAKLGFGSTSTVWLATRKKWLGRQEQVAIKICNSDTSEEDLNHESNINHHLSTANISYPGRAVLGTAIESHEIQSPQGRKHLALVFEPLREPLWMLRRRITHQNRADKHSLLFFKTYIRILLEGLDYMHTAAHVIHTDLKLDNIMVTFEDPSTIDKFINGQARHPMARKHGSDRTVYLCHNDFGPVMSNLGKMIPQITDFGLAQRGDKSEPLIHPIQPNTYRAPEVLLGLGWSYSADMWNFAAMIWDLLAGTSLFHQDGLQPYSPAQHLADMIALIGDVPSSLIEREKQMRHWKWSPAAVNIQGKLCNNATEFYGGPFLDAQGKFLSENRIRRARSLENEVPECIRDSTSEEARLFVGFMRRLLRWIPEERASAADLLSDPWLDVDFKKGQYGLVSNTWRVCSCSLYDSLFVLLVNDANL